jgi:hypothetical protein
MDAELQDSNESNKMKQLETSGYYTGTPKIQLTA